MATEWTWNFFDARVVNDAESGLTDVLKEVNYTLRGRRGNDEKSIVKEIGGRCTLGAPKKESFTPFSELSREKMVDIVSSVVNVDGLKKQVEEWLDAEENKKPLPFE